MRQPVILSFGEVLWDLFPEGEQFGGAPANFACHAAILGGDVSMISAVGNDSHGAEAIKNLEKQGVDVSLIQINPDASTGKVSVVLDSNCKPTYTIHEAAAWDRIEWNDEIEEKIKNSDAIYLGTLGQRDDVSRATICRAAKTAQSAGITRFLDINLRVPFFDDELIRNSIQQASILKLSDEELAEVCAACGLNVNDSPETLLVQLREQQQLDFVVMTCGAKGAILTSANGILKQPGISVTVRDTVGAGDSFSAAFLIGLLQGDAHDQILANACHVPATVCSYAGAMPN